MKSSKKYYKDINIIRLLACISVLLYHLGILKGGYLAVCVFFVLSGYLSVFSSFKKEKFSFKDYYKNRLLKIYLPLLIVVFITIAVISLLPDIIWLNLKPETNSVLLGYNNFWQIGVNLDYFARHTESPFMHFWYIAILLQFDLIFPFIYLTFKKIGDKVNKMIPCIIPFLLGVISCYFLYKMSLNTNIMNAYYNTFARIFSLLFGVCLGFIQGYYGSLIPKFLNKKIPSKIVFYFYLLVLIVMFIFIGSDSKYFVLSMIITSLVTCRLLDYAFLNKNKLGSMDKIVKFISDRSYGIYLFQYPVIYLFQYVNIKDYFAIPIIIIITFILAYIIHLILNKDGNKILRYIFGFIIITISLFGLYKYIITKDHSKEMQELKEQLAANEKLLSKSQEAYTSQLKQEQEEWENVLKDLENGESKLQGIVNNLSVTGIGDSVMLGAVTHLSNQFPNGYFDAAISRTGWVVEGILNNLESKNMSGNPIVLHLGANGDCPESVKRAILAKCNGKEVFWLTVTNDQNVHVNAKIQALAKEYSNLHIIDWNAISKGHSEYFYSDGIHLTPSGRKAYTKAIYDGIYKVYAEEYNQKKEAALKKHEEEQKKKISFYGNEILLNIFDNLETNFKDSNFTINKEYNFDTLYENISKAVSDNTLNYKVVFVFDTDVIVTEEQYQKLQDLCKDHNVYMIFNNQEKATNENLTIVNIFEEVKNNNYLMVDKVHLTKEGNEALSKKIIDMLNGNN